jgi:hypothetical protein
MPLSILIDITNTSQIFPFAFMFISAESAEIFHWVHGQLTKIIFCDCPLTRVVVGDFTTGLAVAMATAKKQVAAETVVVRNAEESGREEGMREEEAREEEETPQSGCQNDDSAKHVSLYDDSLTVRSSSLTVPPNT